MLKRSILALAAVLSSSEMTADAFCSATSSPSSPIGTSTSTRVPPLLSVDKGFNLLELASGVVPQGKIVTAVSETWKFGWKRMMAELAPQDQTGSYQRPKYSFDGRIGDSKFPFEAGRYHLYVGNPCPWCHRVVLALKLLDLDDAIGMTRLEDNPRKASRGGWVFSTQDKDFSCNDLRELYDLLSPGFRGRCTAPLLVDKKSKCIVSNESSDIVRMLANLSTEKYGLAPAPILEEIDTKSEWVYRLLNNGVYRCGFSTSQTAYDSASRDVREGLQRCEDQLKKSSYMCGSDLTETDVVLLPTLLRFDAVYGPLFKAGGSHVRIKDYPSVHRYLRRCWKLPAVQESIDLADACGSYFRQLFPLNPGGIVPTPPTANELGLE